MSQLPINNLDHKSHRTKRPITPILISPSLYDAIKVTCLYLAVDNNTSQQLNSNRAVVTYPFVTSNGIIHLIYYSADLLRLWLRALTNITIWSRKIYATKMIKNKGKPSTYKQEEILCMIMPSLSELIAYCNGDEIRGITMYKAVTVIDRLLINTKNGIKLLTGTNILPGTIPFSNTLATPSNITKIARLLRSGYAKAAVDADKEYQWNIFYRSEMSRLKYAYNCLHRITVTNNTLRTMTSEEAEIYNRGIAESTIYSLDILDEIVDDKDMPNRSLIHTNII